MTQSKPKRVSASTVPTSQLLSDVAGKFTELSLKVTKEVVSSFLGFIENHLSNGSKVRIDKLGILTVKDRAARKGRNPQTGEEIKIPANKKVAFRVAASLKEAVGIKKKKTIPVKKKK